MLTWCALCKPQTSNPQTSDQLERAISALPSNCKHSTVVDIIANACASLHDVSALQQLALRQANHCSVSYREILSDSGMALKHHSSPHDARGKCMSLHLQTSCFQFTRAAQTKSLLRMLAKSHAECPHHVLASGNCLMIWLSDIIEHFSTGCHVEKGRCKQACNVTGRQESLPLRSASLMLYFPTIFCTMERVTSFQHHAARTVCHEKGFKEKRCLV